MRFLHGLSFFDFPRMYQRVRMRMYSVVLFFRALG